MATLQQTISATAVITATAIVALIGVTLVSNVVQDSNKFDDTKIASIASTIRTTSDESTVLSAVLKDTYPNCDISVVTIQYCKGLYISLLNKMGDTVTFAELYDPVASNLYNRIKIRAKQY